MIEKEGQKALAVPADLLDQASLGAAVATVLERWGRIDLIVHNGRYIGPGHMDRFLDTPIELLERQLEANVIAPLVLNRLVLPRMIEQGGGIVVNITSASGYGDPTEPAGAGGWGMGYGISKGAFQRIAGFLAVELRDQGIRCYNVQPGLIATERIGQDMAKFGIANNGAPPEVVARVVGWLATSDEAPSFNGKTIEAQFFCHDRKLLDGWDGPRPTKNNISYDDAAANLTAYETRGRKRAERLVPSRAANAAGEVAHPGHRIAAAQLQHRRRLPLVVGVGELGGPPAEHVEEVPPHLVGVGGVAEPPPGEVSVAVLVTVIDRAGVGAPVDLAPVILGAGGPDHVGDGIDPRFAELGPEAFGQNPLVRLGGEVRSEDLPPLQRTHGADQGDGTAAPRRHGAAEVVAEQGGHRAVDGDVVQVLVYRHVEEVPTRFGGGVVDQGAHLEFGGRGHHGLHRTGVGQVDGQGLHRHPVGGAQAGRTLFQQRRPPGHRDDVDARRAASSATAAPMPAEAPTISAQGP